MTFCWTDPFKTIVCSSMAAGMKAQTLVSPGLRAERTMPRVTPFHVLFLQGCPTRKRTGACANMTFSWTCSCSLLARPNPEGIVSSSPGLRAASYPGTSGRGGGQPQRGCGLGLSVWGAATPLGLTQNLARPTQGSSLLATLGFETESLWDSMGDDAAQVMLCVNLHESHGATVRWTRYARMAELTFVSAT